MKPLRSFHVVLFVAALCLVAPSGAFAMSSGVMADGFLVPLATFSSDQGLDTVVGVTCLEGTGAVYWTFFSANGIPLESGSMDMTGMRLRGFSLAANAPLWPDMSGYLIFTYDDDGSLQPAETRETLAGNAILLWLDADDAAYIPCVPLIRTDYADTAIDLANLAATSLTGLTNGASAEATDYARYWIDPAYSAETELVIWTLNSAVGSGAAEMDNGEDGRCLVQLNLTNSRLNRLDAARLWNRPLDYIEGTVAISGLNTAHIIFSLTSSPLFDALQTFPANCSN